MHIFVYNLLVNCMRSSMGHLVQVEIKEEKKKQYKLVDCQTMSKISHSLFYFTFCIPLLVFFIFRLLLYFTVSQIRLRSFSIPTYSRLSYCFCVCYTTVCTTKTKEKSLERRTPPIDERENR